MKNSLPRWLALSVVALASLQSAQAQIYLQPEAAPYDAVQAAFTQQELDAMLAPIALYPDPLLAQILMASTYPLEVVEAARWSRAIPGVDPQEAVRSVAQRHWDPSVQSLMAFPQVLQMMDSSLEWTQRLGNAFLAQQPQVWATVQTLRQRAYAAGQLRSSDQLRVLHNDSVIVLEPTRPDVVYVPYYDPLVVYGRWWWPGYAPMRWDPWPGYARSPARVGGFYAGTGISVGLGFFFGQINWNTHRVTVLPESERHERYNRPWQPGRDWRHDPQHRGNVPYSGPNRAAPPAAHTAPPRSGPPVNPRAKPPEPPRATPPAAPRATPPEGRNERRPETRPEGQPEFRGQVPHPGGQAGPAVGGVRPAVPAPQDPPQGRSRPGAAPSGAPAGATPPAVAAPPVPRDATPAPRRGNAPTQNTAPSNSERPAAHRAPVETKAPPEQRAAPKESGERNREREQP